VQVPGDRLPLAILVRREQELVGAREQLPQLGHLALLVGVDEVERLEVLLDVDAERAEARPLLLRDLGSALRQVANVTDARLDHELGAEIAGDRPRLGGRLDDDETRSWHRGTP
jgi:hypothetical protein